MMKLFPYIILFLFVCFYGCTQNKPDSLIYPSCPNGNILIVHAGWNDKSVYPLLISTNSNDSSYHRFINKKFDDYGFIISTIDNKYMHKEYINDDMYTLLKDYIIKNNTGKSNFETNRQYDRFKIVLLDRYDYILFGIDSSESTYFKNLIEKAKETENKNLLKELDSYENILTNNTY